MNRWELKYHVERIARWIWKRTVTGLLLSGIVGALVFGSWAASTVADHYGADLLFWACALLVITAGYWLLDHVLWD